MDCVSIITRGFGGLGLVTVETLVELGATHAALTSRSKVKNYEVRDLQKRLNRLLKVCGGTAVLVKCCDMCDEDAVCSFIKKVILHSLLLLQETEIILNHCFGQMI